jgi:hypothetical protein
MLAVKNTKTIKFEEVVSKSKLKYHILLKNANLCYDENINRLITISRRKSQFYQKTNCLNCKDLYVISNILRKDL